MKTNKFIQATRKLYNLCKGDPDRVRRLHKLTNVYEFIDLAMCDELTSENKVIKLINGLREGLITVDEFTEGDYISDDTHYYSSQDYVETREGDVLPVDDAHFCEYFQEYSIQTFEVITGRNSSYYCADAINDVSTYDYDGQIYTIQGLSYHDLIITEEGDVLREDEAYYIDGNYYTEAPKPRFVREYHENKDVNFVKFTENPTFFIGFELEKEDQAVKESLEIRDFEEKCTFWRKEKDGSLDDRSGFELISPAFELVPDKIKEEISKNPTLLDHVNAKIETARCGGHVNVSEKGLTGVELFDKLKGYTPLFYALYYKRVSKDYSKGKSNKDLKDENNKYQAVKIHNKHLEYRIVSACPNLYTLTWRAELFKIILDNPTDCPKVAFFNVQTILKKHLETMYPGNKFEKLNSRLIEYTKSFEGIDLVNTNKAA